MSAVSVWVLSIVGVVVLSIIVDLILPSGSTSKFVKNIFAFVIVIVILSPIVSFLSNKDFNLDNLFTNNDVTVQEDFIYSVNRQKLNKMKEDVSRAIVAHGIKGVNVGVEGNIFERDLKIENVNIDLKNLVIDENFSHINIKTSITQIVLRMIDVKEEQIIFYE